MAVWSEVNLAYVQSHKRIDSNFFQEEYIELDKKISNGLTIEKTSRTVDLQSNGAFQQIFEILNDNNPKIILYIRSGNVGQMFLNKKDLQYISKEAHSKLFKTHTKYGDILIARKGKIGGATLIRENDVSLNSNDNVVNIRLNDNTFLPEYFATFWNCKYGLKQIFRFATGNVQPWLSMTQIRLLKTVFVEYNHQKKIANLVNNAYTKYTHAQALYTQAQQFLEHELGLDKLKFKKPVGYETSFSEVVNNNRSDADYYQVKFRSLEKHIRNINTKPLSQIANFTKGIEVGSSVYTDEGKLFLRVSNVKENGIETGSSDKYISNNLFSSLQIFQPEINELLLTKDGTPGICYVVDKIIDGIISGGIVKIKIIDTSVPAEYLALVINSKICRMQVERVCSGALIVHWKPGDISKLQIPILSDGTMKKLSKLVAKSKQAKRESQQLLNQAKTRVEQLIEEATGENGRAMENSSLKICRNS